MEKSKRKIKLTKESKTKKQIKKMKIKIKRKKTKIMDPMMKLKYDKMIKNQNIEGITLNIIKI
jgi:hypothetical protein